MTTVQSKSLNRKENQLLPISNQSDKQLINNKKLFSFSRKVK